MKKLLPYIFMALLVLGGVFGPFGGVPVAEAIFGIPSAGEIGEKLVAFIAYFFLWIGSWILGAAGVLLDISVKLSITDMKTMVNDLGAVQEGWATFRDIANIFFIFIIIWIAISTILQIDRYGIKQLLAKVIIVALLMNFSLFFTKVVIDASNIVAISFYSAMKVQVTPASGGPATEGSISSAFMKAFNLTTLYNPNLPTTAAQAVPVVDVGRTLLVGVIGFVVMLIAAFIFFTAAGLFIIRFVVLVLLMVLSPLAFLAMILPGASGMSKKWRDTLFSQCLFAPIYMMLTWFVVKVISSDGFQNSLKGLQPPGPPSAGTGFAAAFADGVATSAITQIFLNFFVVTVFLVAALIIAKSMASSGAPAISAAVDWTTKKAGGVFTRNTVGRVGGLTKRLAERAGKAVEGRRFAAPLTATLRGIKNVGESGEKMKGIIPGFGDRSRADMREAREKRVEAGIRERRDNPEQLAKYLVSLRPSERRHAYEKLSPRDRAEVEEKLKGRLGGAGQKTWTWTGRKDMADTLRTTLSVEERDKVDDEVLKLRQAVQARATRTKLNDYAKNPTAAPLTAVELDTYVRTMRTNQARHLNPEARANPEIVKRLTPAHLRDLMEHGDLQPNEVENIVNVITGPPYPNQMTQLNYISSGPVQHLWTP